EKPRAKWLIPTILTGAAATIALLGWQSGIISSPPANPAEHAAQSNPKPVPSGVTGTPAIQSIAAPANEASQIDAARAFLQRREYAKAEEVYRSILKTDPQNREVVLALADVLYRQNKFEESAGVLKALSTQPRP
ncbi:MAG: tetratricopeptide repeat protein, partial [Acidobacteriota bacterium]|nr:tetratricopeptide repeat protein [Acidobacteriota bacterium]